MDPAYITEKKITRFGTHLTISSEGKYIISTTTVRDRVDVAITPVEQLIEMTK